MPRRNLSAIILAAGFSSRMGGFKPLMTLGGKPAIQWVVELFKHNGISEVRVVVGYRSEELVPLLTQLGATIIENPQPEQGMFSSVLHGLHSLPSSTEGFFLIPADIPLVRAGTLSKLLEAYDHSDAPVIYPCFQGLRGHPPLITRSCFELILSNQTGNLQEILKTWNSDALEVPTADQWIHRDMDSPEDYQSLQQELGFLRIPTPGECHELMTIYQATDRVMDHCKTVAGVAEILGTMLNKTPGSRLNLPLLQGAALLHDIARSSRHHGIVGGQLLEKEGFPSLKPIVEHHMDLKLPEGDFELTEAEILYLADKMVAEDRIVTLEQRFSEAYSKNSGKSAAVKSAGHRYDVACRIRKQVEKRLGISDIFPYLFHNSRSAV